jgi:iron complex transport system substrate-binding protein
MELLGKIFCEEEKADALIQYVQDQAAEITARTKDISEENKPSVYVCGLGNWGTTDHLMTAENPVLIAAFNLEVAVR